MRDLIPYVAAGGLMLLLSELVLPGLVSGILGCMMLLAAAIMVWLEYGQMAGQIAVGAVLIGVPTGVALWLRVLPRTRLGRAFSLTSSVEGKAGPTGLQALIGQRGSTVTPLLPGGAVEVGGKRYDATALGGFIESGRVIRVMKVEGATLFVSEERLGA